ncbi:MAG TPA: hypothetical protein VHE37_00925, partial [Nevskiaceae bacterium]|nr:hypothetical protein [Nevskiaceae bacterium]
MGIISAGSAAGGRIAEHPALTASIALRAAMVSLLWLLLLVLLMHPTIVAYHPVSDEWALLQHSTASGGEVAGWFRDGFSRYFTSWPGVDTPPMQFLRPVFNAVYLLLGALLGVGSGQYLYVTAAAIAACAGLVYAAGAQRQPATALPLALLLPLLPGFAGSIALLFVPCFMFDALAAAACLGAYLAYQRQRYIWAMVWLALAVLAKETAVPVAAAFVVHAALAWLAAPSPQRLRPVLLLAAPLAAWALLRLAAFHGIVGGVYVSGHNAGVLARMLSHVDQYPYFVDYMAPGSHGKSVRLLGWLNLLLASIGVTLMAARAWRHRKLELAELALLFSYVFLLVLGTSARFGASLDAFLLLSWLHWNREPPSSIWRSLATVGGALLLVGAGLYGWQSAHMYDLYRDDYARMYR